MQTVPPIPAAGEVFLDARGGPRALRVSWHDESGVVVLSIWREGTCAGSFRLDVEDVPTLVDFLREGLAREYDAARASLLPGMRPADELAV